MTRLKAWIALLALTSFLGGLAGGVLLGLRLAPRPEGRRAFADYEELLAQEFELPPDRRHALRIILDYYERELDALGARHQTPGMQAELDALGARCSDWIRNKVLPEERRAQFDQLALGLEAPSASG